MFFYRNHLKVVLLLFVLFFIFIISFKLNASEIPIEAKFQVLSDTESSGEKRASVIQELLVEFGRNALSVENANKLVGLMFLPQNRQSLELLNLSLREQIARGLGYSEGDLLFLVTSSYMLGSEYGKIKEIRPGFLIFTKRTEYSFGEMLFVYSAETARLFTVVALDSPEALGYLEREASQEGLRETIEFLTLVNKRITEGPNQKHADLLLDIVTDLQEMHSISERTAALIHLLSENIFVSEEIRNELLIFLIGEKDFSRRVYNRLSYLMRLSQNNPDLKIHEASLIESGLSLSEIPPWLDSKLPSLIYKDMQAVESLWLALNACLNLDAKEIGVEGIPFVDTKARAIKELAYVPGILRSLEYLGYRRVNVWGIEFILRRSGPSITSREVLAFPPIWNDYYRSFDRSGATHFVSEVPRNANAYSNSTTLIVESLEVSERARPNQMNLEIREVPEAVSMILAEYSLAPEHWIHIRGEDGRLLEGEALRRALELHAEKRFEIDGRRVVRKVEVR
ncbi:MAG: hypothetical protein ABIA04_16425 [Pseudomonadota bacterium]